MILLSESDSRMMRAVACVVGELRIPDDASAIDVFKFLREQLFSIFLCVVGDSTVKDIEFSSNGTRGEYERLETVSIEWGMFKRSFHVLSFTISDTSMHYGEYGIVIIDDIAVTEIVLGGVPDWYDGSIHWVANA